MSNRKDQGVSIIVPTFREIENLPMLIERIGALRCEFPDLELVIVDDDSQDGTAELLNVLCTVHDCQIQTRRVRSDLGCLDLVRDWMRLVCIWQLCFVNSSIGSAVRLAVRKSAPNAQRAA